MFALQYKSYQDDLRQNDVVGLKMSGSATLSQRFWVGFGKNLEIIASLNPCSIYRNIQQFDNIEHSLEKIMISSEQYYESQKDINNHHETGVADPKKEKKIKKRKNKRNYSRITQASDDMSNLEELISSTGGSYFGQSKDEISNQFCYNFKTNLHLRNIIGKESNVYNIKKSESCVNEALQYLQLIRNRHRGRVSKVLLSNQNTKKALKYINICSKQNRKLVLLDKEEAMLLSRRHEMQVQMENFFTQNLSNSQGMELDFLTKELLTLCKLNSIQENEVVQKIYSYAVNSSDVLHNAHLSSLQIYKKYQQKYLQFLMRKNMQKGLEQTPIDMLNYFNVIDSDQKKIYDDTTPTLCKTLDELKFYLKIKKPKLGKHADDSLKTCCSACFSNYYEVMNPIETCSECGMRMHKLCRNIKSKCQRCKYIRKTIEQKSSIPYCLICQRQKQQNISIQFIYDGQKQYYAHTFCLLTTGSWSIQNKQVAYQMPKSLKTQAQTCKVCNTANSFCIDCKCCNGKVHGLCAFLEGYSMKLNDSGQLFVECCRNESNNKRLSLIRKFKMNYQKILYKNNEELFKMIQENQ